MEEKEEIWKPIEEMDSLYEVSNLGRVKRLERYSYRIDGKMNHFMEAFVGQNVHSDGYIFSTLQLDGAKWTTPVHRLVATAFVPNDDPENKREVNHKDGNKQNNCADNLEWVTRQENILHAERMGLIHHPSGKDHARSKPVDMIDLKTGEVIKTFESANMAKKELGMASNHISNCCNGTRNSYGGFGWKYHNEEAEQETVTTIENPKEGEVE